MLTFEVRIWSIRKHESTSKSKKRAKPATTYSLRWVVGGETHCLSFATQALADGYRSSLVTATRQGEAFDTESGEPISWKKQAEPELGPTWFEHALAYVEMKWPRVSGNFRAGIADALTTVTVELVHDRPGRPLPDVLRAALRGWAFNLPKRGSEPDPEAQHAIAWVRGASLQLADLSDTAVTRRALDSLALRLDGKPAAAKTVTRKRATLYNALRYAVELDLLPGNPIDRVQWAAPKVAEAVDRRVVANPDQARAIIAEVKAIRPDLEAFFGCLYFAALRPAEAVALVDTACELPEKGWGRLDLAKSSPRVGRAWTDSGDTHDDRGLKHRASNDARSVPIPPELVLMLRRHLGTIGTHDGGRLFWGTRDHGLLAESVYGPVWHKARAKALSKAQAATKLAARPYDLRHAAVSLWLNAGVPATEVADRAGHSVHVLLKVYAKCIDGQEAAVNGRIMKALGGGDDGEGA
jgi:integrase